MIKKTAKRRKRQRIILGEGYPEAENDAATAIRLYTHEVVREAMKGLSFQHPNT